MQFNPGDKVRLKAGEPWKTDPYGRKTIFEERWSLLGRETLTFQQYNSRSENGRTVRLPEHCEVTGIGVSAWVKTSWLEPVVEDTVLFDWTSKDGRFYYSRGTKNGTPFWSSGGAANASIEALITELTEAKHRIQCLETTLADVREKIEEVSA